MELPDGIRKMNFCDIIKELERQSSPRPSDYSMNKLYSYITRFLSHFSKERFMIGGSTEENTRTSIDDGDYDYLLISEIAVPSEYIEYKRDRPSCFDHVNGSFMQEQFPDIEMVDGQYLPSSLLSEIKPEAFKHVGDIIKLLLRNRNTIFIDQKIKLGLSITIYEDSRCSDPGITLPDASKTLVMTLADSLDKAIQNNPSASTEKINQLLEKYRALSKPLNDNHEQYWNERLLKNTSSRCGNDDKIGVNEVKIFYSRKKHKDYISMFPIKGNPKGLDKWIKRDRKSHWPPEDTVNRVSKCQFFLVAKPAPVKAEKEKDFCLAYSMAEKELSEALKPVQKRVLLIVKAFNKCTLRNHSKIVTSFHWKTALYWISESVDQSIIEQNTEKNVSKLLHLVLDYMTKCLTELNLQHYFIESNLFEGMDHQDASSINQLILEIQKDPETELRLFVSMDGYGLEQCETMTRKKLEKCLMDYNDHQLTLRLFKAVFNRYIEEKDKLREAFRDVLISIFDDFVERESKERNTFVSYLLLLWALKFKFVKEKLIKELGSYFLYLVGGFEEEKGCFLVRKFFSFFIYSLLKRR
ncbi:Hypothetical predicted protein [Mytilus galloprovincialis]|uniref:Mab-21-like HhH/H2TH-like domain-containing protein n=1 Tax=Mytilus galloprovincialis TaxID=29158 RepID=A0A8B6GXJ0_MYTGA|nr:Hypothetical predicted protein [Mytilus galloprovincialis]